jgi:hypothetical protein
VSEPAASPSPAPTAPAAAPAAAEAPRALPPRRRRARADDDNYRPLLRLGAAVQAVASVPPALFFAAVFWNDWVHRRVYERGNGRLWHAAFWAAAPLSLALVPFLWTRRRWAYRATLALWPLWVAGPLAYLYAGLAPKGGEDFYVFMAGAGALVAAVVVSLLRKGRPALDP